MQTNFDPSFIQQRFDYEQSLLDSQETNNCGYLHYKTLSLKITDSFKNKEELNAMNKVFSLNKTLSECRAIVDGEQVWVRITETKGNKKCQLFMPYNIISLFNEDGDEYPHVNMEMFEATFDGYSKCEDIEEEEESNNHFGLSDAQEEVIVSSFVNNALTVDEVEGIKDLDNNDKKALVDELTKKNTMNVNPADIEGLSQTGKAVLKDFVFEHVSENNVRKVLRNPVFNNAVAKFEETHPEFKNKQETGLTGAAKPEIIVPVLNNGEKYLYTSNFNEDATYCNEYQINRVVSLYKALATERQLKSVQIYEQNVTECIASHDNKQFTAVLKFNDKPCLFNIVVDHKKNSVTLVKAKVNQLLSCQDKALFE